MLPQLTEARGGGWRSVSGEEKGKEEAVEIPMELMSHEIIPELIPPLWAGTAVFESIGCECSII